jgi:PAS domain S-box-containing protein
MISYAALGRFASDFLVFLVGVGGLALVALRPDLLSPRRAARVALAAGFMAAGAASFLEGSLIVGSTSNPVVAALRAVGILGLLLGSREWAAGPRSQRVLWIGLVAMLLATAVLALRQSTTWGETALGVAGLAIGVALRVASERSIAARVAANSAVILLLVVLVLSVSLSAVIGTTVRNDAGSRLDARAASEADFAQRIEPENAVVVARNVALTFDTNTGLEAETARLVGLGDTSAGTLTPAYGSVFEQIQEFLAPAYALAYVNSAGHVYAMATPAHFDQGVVTSAIASDNVKQAFADPIVGVRASIGVFKNTAFVVAVQVVAHHLTAKVFDYPTAVVAVEPLDNAYLANERQPLDPNVSLAIVSPTSVLASAGNPGPVSALIGLANRTLGDDQPIALATGHGLLSSTRPLKAGSTPVAVLVASTPGTVVTDARNKLLRTLFLLAMAGTLLAVALAAYAGERVSSGIRALTQAAQRIQEGNFVEPAGVRTDDEVGVLGGAFDSMALSIAEQTAALQEAAEEETGLRSQLQAVVAGMGEALVAVDANGRITLFNRAAEELVGLDGEDVLGELVGDVLVAIGEDGSVLANRLQRPSPARWGVSATVATELGPRIPVAITSGALRGLDGSITGAVLVLRDLRPEREVERMKSEFLSRIGHELRTPLTGILGYAEILLRRPVPESRARDMHQQIVDAGRRLYRVVQMLEFSAAAEAGRSLLRSEPMSVREIVDEVVAGWGPRLNGNHVVARRVARRLPDVRGDRRWLAMAIDELIDNAVKFSPDGGRVGVIAQPVQWFDAGESRTAVQIVVTDEGVGLTESEQHSAFSDFVQGDGSDTRRFGGLGLGLSLVKRVAEAHGGTVEVNSTPRKGSKFSIILPVISGDEEA